MACSEISSTVFLGRNGTTQLSIAVLVRNQHAFVGANRFAFAVASFESMYLAPGRSRVPPCADGGLKARSPSDEERWAAIFRTIWSSSSSGSAPLGVDDQRPVLLRERSGWKLLQ